MRAFTVAAVLLCAATGGCSSTRRGASEQACAPGEVRGCPGPGDCAGRQSCDDLGRGFGECICDRGRDEAAGGAPPLEGGGGGSSGAEAATEGTCPTGLPGPRLVAVPAPDGGRYCIDETEVTQADYARFLTAAEIDPPPTPAACAWNDSLEPRIADNNCSWQTFDPASKPAYPIACVDWCDARAFCSWAGKRLCGSMEGGSNPFDAFDDTSRSEWFNACSKGGTRDFPYGAIYEPDACSSTAPRPVGSAPACVGGFPSLHDMSGNVWEWEDSCDGTGDGASCCRLRGGSYGAVVGENTLRCDGVHTACLRRRDAYASVGVRCCADAL